MNRFGNNSAHRFGRVLPTYKSLNFDKIVETNIEKVVCVEKECICKEEEVITIPQPETLNQEVVIEPMVVTFEPVKLNNIEIQGNSTFEVKLIDDLLIEPLCMGTIYHNNNIHHNPVPSTENPIITPNSYKEPKMKKVVELAIERFIRRK